MAEKIKIGDKAKFTFQFPSASLMEVEGVVEKIENGKCVYFENIRGGYNIKNCKLIP